MSHLLRRAAAAALFSLLTLAGLAAPAAKPLKVLLITGGCCHDYVAQKDILKAGIEKRANIVLDHMHTPDKSTKPPLECLTNPKYADGYDVVIHDECAADIKDPAMVRNVLQPHLNGTPGVALHCAMHSYRVVPDFARPQTPGSEGALWFDFLGLQSNRHGPQEPIAVKFSGSSPITRGMSDWLTGREELYNNTQPPSAFRGHTSLATGRQTVTNKKDGSKSDAEAVVVWTNEFGPKKARVFATTLGHNNVTVEDSRYLDLVTRGVLWAAGKLRDDGKPAAGYEAPAR